MNRTDFKFYKQKHAEEEKKLKRSISTGMSPFTYNPISYGTFDSIANNKKIVKINIILGTIEMESWSN